MRVTRAALRAQQIHEDDVEESTLTNSTLSTETPSKTAVLQDITSRNVLMNIETPKTPQIQQDVEVGCGEPNSPDRTSDELEALPRITPKTPRFDPLVHKEEEQLSSADKAEENKEDSFVEHIIARSPAKSAPRIEDSVEAMDALEDAIERVSEDLPMISELDTQSPVRIRKSTSRITPMSAPNSTNTKSVPMKAQPTPRKSPSKSISKAMVSTKTQATPRKSSPLKNTVSKRGDRLSTVGAPLISSLLPPKKLSPVVKATVKPVSKPIRTEAATLQSKGQIENPSSKPLARAQPNTMQKRKTSGTLSTSKPGFIPTKSTKTPTTSAFVLPGEAVAAKLKAQREERQKKEEVAPEQGKEFKARPAPTRHPRQSVLPRETKTSRARISMMAGGKETVEPTTKSTPSEAPTKRNTLSVSKTRPEPNKPKSAIRRTTIVPRVASLQTSSTTIAAKEDIRLNPEEVRARTKKAREDAAEKGRLASREWAEKQKKRVTGVKAKETAEGANVVDLGSS